MKVTGYTTKTSGDVLVQRLDSIGDAVATYEWHDFEKKDKATQQMVHYYGWYDQKVGKYITEGEVILPAGTGLWVKAPSADWKLECNGQVLTKGQSFKLRENFLMVSNPYPVDVDLYSMSVSGYTAKTSGDVIAQRLDSIGDAEATYEWHDFEKKDKATQQMVHYYGWYDQKVGKYISKGEVTISPNDALWVKAPNDTWYLNFPGILEDAPTEE